VKGLGWFVVILLDFFFVYFSILRGIQRGLVWQRGYAIACVAQFVIEVFLYETSECLWMNFVIPESVKEDIENIRFSLKSAVSNLCAISKRDDRYILDAPSYLFVSSILAKKFPEKLESMIILSYKNHLPGPVCAKWKKTVRKSVMQGCRNISVVAMSVVLMKSIGSLPRSVQRIAIHSLQPLFVAAFLVLMIFFWDHPLFAFILVAPLVFKLVHFLMVALYNPDSAISDFKRRKAIRGPGKKLISNVAPADLVRHKTMMAYVSPPPEEEDSLVLTQLSLLPEERESAWAGGGEAGGSDCSSVLSSGSGSDGEFTICVKTRSAAKPIKVVVVPPAAEKLSKKSKKKRVTSESKPKPKKKKKHIPVSSNLEEKGTSSNGLDASAVAVVANPRHTQDIDQPPETDRLTAAIILSDRLQQLGGRDESDSYA
jgi:hypothetical protein